MSARIPSPSVTRRALGAKSFSSPHPPPLPLPPPSKKSRMAMRQPLRSIENSLMRRELGAADSSVLTEIGLRDCFGSMHISHTLDVVDTEVMRLSLPFLRKRSQVVEVLCCGGFIFVLTHNGLCAAFTSHGRRLGLLNVEHDEVVRSLFYNKTNRSIISVSVFNRDKYTSLHCRSTALAHFSLGTGAAAGFPIFTTENLQWPGFVEFDDVNSRVLTYNASSLTYRVWDLCTYTEIFSICDPYIAEIKVSTGIMLLMYSRPPGHSFLPIKLVSVVDGAPLRSIRVRLLSNDKVDFLELCDNSLLIKQKHHALQVCNIFDGSVTTVPASVFKSPEAFIFLLNSSCFLTLDAQRIRVWNATGACITNFDDHVLTPTTQLCSGVSVFKSQSYIASYCIASARNDRGRENDSPGGAVAKNCAIHVSSLSSGRLVAALAPEGRPFAEQVALQDCTCLVYCEEHAQLLTGTSDGRVHIWIPTGGGKGEANGSRRAGGGDAAASAAHAMIDNA